ncbi:MAG TPA: hypoxanthine phosphoribosyltransferase [Anaerolineae bacterium]|nr:hypoxanthine phosphoribosyltransferase [Anaerolineae bacterium]
MALANPQDDLAYVLIEEGQLKSRLQAIAQEILADYADEEDLLLVCILKGSYIVLADLCRHLTRFHEVDFMAVSSYGGGTESSGAVQILMDLKQDIAGRHVILVEDIIDSGRTLSYIRRLLEARGPASLRIMTLLNKPSRREVEVDVEYIGFDIPDEFVVGYGLDYDQRYRHFPFIGVLKPTVFGGE